MKLFVHLGAARVTLRSEADAAWVCAHARSVVLQPMVPSRSCPHIHLTSTVSRQAHARLLLAGSHPLALTSAQQATLAARCGVTGLQFEAGEFGETVISGTVEAADAVLTAAQRGDALLGAVLSPVRQWEIVPAWRPLFVTALPVTTVATDVTRAVNEAVASQLQPGASLSVSMKAIGGMLQRLVWLYRSWRTVAVATLMCLRRCGTSTVRARPACGDAAV